MEVTLNVNLDNKNYRQLIFCFTYDRFRTVFTLNETSTNFSERWAKFVDKVKTNDTEDVEFKGDNNEDIIASITANGSYPFILSACI